ncbi:excalibur calcium-binding domain-containing protein [Phyllobacterium bourgognense]|uniref:Excalibur calcium-binding domain-containing protein n=1 Tax=Phyllobacterium bourgognense TaxID=314236 RepID=A0A368YP66_9HYPH|nr:excalibur calcium-binding domain-containing protein [Phyllobacterium bourgognense]RCW82021.1 excalibur calcium-binding domain-containing protein [Phyllobacterium bourgognense]
MKKQLFAALGAVMLAGSAMAQDYSAIPESVRNQINQKCANQWQQDYSMRAYCIRTDSNGYLELLQLGGTSGGTKRQAQASSVQPIAPVYRAPAAASGVYFPNCTAARAAGAAPIRVGQAGYARKLDRDGDGIACE